LFRRLNCIASINQILNLYLSASLREAALMNATTFPSSTFKERLVRLPSQALWKLDLSASAAVIVECLSGLAWITVEGKSRDVILPAGERSTISGPGLLLASGLQSALVRVVPAASVARRAK
jgi:hypothetical protein